MRVGNVLIHSCLDMRFTESVLKFSIKVYFLEFDVKYKDKLTCFYKQILI